MLDLNNGLVRKVLALMGYASPEELADDQARIAARSYVLGRMEAAYPVINKAMKKAGVTPAKGDTAYIRDALFRLWNHLLPGDFADFIRDSHEGRLIAQLAEQISAETKPIDALKLVANATVSLVF